MPLNRATGIDASTSLSTFGYPNPTSATGGSLDLSGLLASIRSNFTINGGGTIFFSGSSYLSWSQRFIVMQAGSRNTNFAIAGYFDINMPAAGTVVIGLGGAADRLVDATGIQINAWESLYYVLPINSNNASIATNFRIVQYTANYDIPAHWVRIATRSGDGSSYLYLNNGIVLGAGEYSAAGIQTLNAVAHSIVKRDGSGNAWSSGIAQHDGTNTLGPYSSIKTSSTRTNDLAPNTYGYGLFSEFKSTPFAGVTSGTYGGLLTYAVWQGNTFSTGDPSYQLLFHPAGVNSTLPPLLKIRAGIDTTWGSWSTILHSSNASSFVISQNGDLSAAADWNTYTTAGIYRYGRADWTGVTNNPAAAAYTFGTLSVLGTGTNGITQVYYPHQAGSGVWYRTKWNASDWTAWGQLLDNSSTTQTKTGSLAAASFIPTSSSVPTNGMYLSGTNTLNFATNTTNRMQVSSAGLVGINGIASVTQFLVANSTAGNIGQVIRGAASQTASLQEWQNSAESVLSSISSSGALSIPSGSVNATATLSGSTRQFTILAPSTAQGNVSGITFYSTFTGTADNGARRSADITSGYSGGAWGNEYLSFNVGTGAQNDAANLTTERMRIFGLGAIKFSAALAEAVTVSATAAATTVTYDTMTNKNVLYYTSNATANWTFNVRGNSTTTLNTIMDNGQSLTVVFMNTNGTTAYYPTAFQVDGTAVTPKWVNGTAPSAGNASSIDVYTYNIIKTAANTYTVLASQSRFA